MALLDRDGVCGAPRFFGPARENGLRARVGAEITMEDGSVVPLLATSQTGYQNLCQLITESKLTDRPPDLVRRVSAGTVFATQGGSAPDPHAPDPRDRKRPCFATWTELARYNDGLIALTGDEDGPVRSAWLAAGASAANNALQQLLELFGRDRLYVELQRHRLRGEER